MRLELPTKTVARLSRCSEAVAADGAPPASQALRSWRALCAATGWAVRRPRQLPTRAVVVLSWALSVDAAPTAPRRSRNPTASRRTAPLPVPLLGGLLSPEMPKAQS